MREGSYDAEENAGAAWRNELSGTVQGPSVQARSIQGGVQFNIGTQSPMPVPAQLPFPAFFANRHEELTDLQRLAAQITETDRRALIVITGAGGIGKTTLGLHWLHQLRDGYGDGQLFVDLRGFSGAGPPMPSGEPLERFIRALGIGSDSIPVNPDEQAALFRTLTVDRRLIIMLDNAASAAQVRPLLPGPGPALVVVTTRQRLSGLAVEGGRFLDLAPLDESGAVELLDRMVGSDRIRAEPAEASSLVSLCGRLPLAVCASGARLAARRRWTIARVVAELTDETNRLSTLSTEDDVSVKAVFDLSYRALSDEAARLYRLLGLHPGSDFDSGAVAALADLDHHQATNLLDILVGANLLQEGPGDRYRFHDLLRLHAREKMMEIESKADRRACFTRLTGWYLKTAVAADLAIQPGRWHLGRHYAHYEAEPQVLFDSRATAIAWLEAELTNLIAVAQQAHDQGFHEITWQMVEALWNLFNFRKHYRVWIESHQLGLAAAQANGDRKAQARMLEGMAMAYLNLQDFPAAIDLSHQALYLERDAGHRIGEASPLEYLGTAELASGQSDLAIGYFTQARDIHRQLGHARGVALMTRQLGRAFSAAGRHSEAIELFADALRFFTQADEFYHQARTLNFLADTYLQIGRLDDADQTLHKALTITQQIGARHEQAGGHVALARLAVERNDLAAERDHLQQALAIYAELGAPQATEVRRRLAEVFPEPPGHEAGSPH